MLRLLGPRTGGDDVFGWIRFARNLFLVLLVSVVTLTALAGLVATRQAQGLLEASLATRGRTLADAAARAAFVPLSLEDDAALKTLLSSYRDVPDLAWIRLEDAKGRVRAVWPPRRTPAAAALMEQEAPVVPPGRVRARRAIGTVRTGMSGETIRHESRRIALFNLAGGVGLAALVLFAGSLLLRNVIGRMREVVGEAAMARALQQANAELEAFSYSVSHDLRAPLRAVDGFSHILLEDYGTKLDAEGRDYLERVRRGCQRMGDLIDDLLKLSRVTRQELRLEETDLAVLARSIGEQLAAAHPDRQVLFTVPDRVPVRGDAGLLRAALENLLGNAWKFTAKEPRPRVEFGVLPGPAGRTFFVKDNGAGFDMAYAGKLFGAFQRLHSQEEFAGTGIGLATVQRIVARHGGRVWAEGAVGRGATFSFTLGRP